MLNIQPGPIYEGEIYMKMLLYNLREYMETLQGAKIPSINEHVILHGKDYIVVNVCNDFDLNCFHVFMKKASDNDVTYFDSITKG